MIDTNILKHDSKLASKNTGAPALAATAEVQGRAADGLLYRDLLNILAKVQIMSRYLDLKKRKYIDYLDTTCRIRMPEW